MTEQSERSTEIVSGSEAKAHEEYIGLQIQLPDNQESALKSLIQDLICAEGYATDPVLSKGPNPYLFKAVDRAVDAIREGVPREVFLVVLHRDFIKQGVSDAHSLS